jgi:hypothetical protein
MKFVLNFLLSITSLNNVCGLTQTKIRFQIHAHTYVQNGRNKMGNYLDKK